MLPFPPGEYQQRIDETKASITNGTPELGGGTSSI